VSIELTTMMLATLFDFPFHDRRKLTRWSDVATGRSNPDVVSGEEQWRGELMECLGYFTRLWNERVNAEPKGDLISMLAHGEHTRNMTPQEYLGNLILLIVGGNDTTRNSMTGGVYAMMKKFPDQWEKLKANPELVPSAVSEIIRWQTPLAHMRRTALEDFELGGQTIKKGEKVLMWYVSGNRDETQYTNPNDLWIERPMVRRHLSFGFGIHRCVGNRLAELQLQILWEEILKRFDRIEVLSEPERLPSAFVKGYTKMMVKVTPKA
jgi:cytochrome P450